MMIILTRNHPVCYEMVIGAICAILLLLRIHGFSLPPQDLRRCYDGVCFFFHDPFGGDVIGVLWRPEMLRQRPLDQMSAADDVVVVRPGMRFVEKTVGALTGDLIEDLGKKKTHAEFNVQAFVEDVKIMGDGLVANVEVKTENWSSN